jgi:hypothetical protein
MTEQQIRLLPDGITPELVEETRSVFQAYYAEPLTDDDCIEMLVNVFRLYEVLFADDDSRDTDQIGK